MATAALIDGGGKGYGTPPPKNTAPKAVGIAPPKPAAPPAAAPPVDYGYYGGGGGDLSAPPVTPAPIAAPPPMKDVDWFNKDAVYRGQAGRALADATAQLAQLLADRDQGFQQLDMTRGNLDRSRTEDLRTAGNDFAGRGVLGSGLYAQFTDRLGADYARQGEAVNSAEQQLVQQYGKRGTNVDINSLAGMSNNGMGNLDSIFGLLGALGVGVGNQYKSTIADAMAESAGRSAVPLIQTLAAY